MLNMLIIYLFLVVYAANILNIPEIYYDCLLFFIRLK